MMTLAVTNTQFTRLPFAKSGRAFFDNFLITIDMEKYITKDKVGEFCQLMFNNGFDVVTSSDSISVRNDEGSYVHIKVYEKKSFDDLVARVIYELDPANEE